MLCPKCRGTGWVAGQVPDPAGARPPSLLVEPCPRGCPTGEPSPAAVPEEDGPVCPDVLVEADDEVPARSG